MPLTLKSVYVVSRVDSIRFLVPTGAVSSMEHDVLDRDVIDRRPPPLRRLPPDCNKDKYLGTMPLSSLLTHTYSYFLYHCYTRLTLLPFDMLHNTTVGNGHVWLVLLSEDI